MKKKIVLLTTFIVLAGSGVLYALNTQSKEACSGSCCTKSACCTEQSCTDCSCGDECTGTNCECGCECCK